MIKKKSFEIEYHRVREAIAAKVLRFAHVRLEDNLADILTKALPNPAFHRLLKPILFRVSAHVKTEHDAYGFNQVTYIGMKLKQAHLVPQGEKSVCNI